MCVVGTLSAVWENGRPMDVPIPYRYEFSKVASPRSEKPEHLSLPVSCPLTNDHIDLSDFLFFLVSLPSWSFILSTVHLCLFLSLSLSLSVSVSLSVCVKVRG